MVIVAVFFSKPQGPKQKSELCPCDRNLYPKDIKKIEELTKLLDLKKRNSVKEKHPQQIPEGWKS